MKTFRLAEWLNWADGHGSNSLRAISEAAFIADSKNYDLLRPTLLNLKDLYPRE
jgi:hypothetical protein